MLRIIITLVIHYGWDLRQYDVTNAFLHGDIEEEIYMDIPSGFKGDFAAEKVCWLKKALYGLKQSPRAWFGRFAKTVISMEYKQSSADPTLFINNTEGKFPYLWCT